MDMNYDWVKNIPILVDNINKTYHTQIKTTPQAVEDEIDNKEYIEEQHEIQKTNKSNSIVNSNSKQKQVHPALSLSMLFVYQAYVSMLNLNKLV